MSNHITVKFVLDGDLGAFDKLRSDVLDSMRKHGGYNGVYVEVVSAIDINQQLEDIQAVSRSNEIECDSEKIEKINKIFNKDYTK